MKELNERAALNHQLEVDAAQTMYNRIEAKRRQSARRINRAYRKSVTIVAIDAALIGVSLAGCVAAVAYLICVAVM